MSDNILNGLHIENLNKENYDTWRMQVEAHLIKNDMWEYVCGEKPKPEINEETQADQIALDDWTRQDRKAKSDLILCISPSELKHIKDCSTSREIWEKLESIYTSKEPARKTSLLKQLVRQKMNEGDKIREHISSFFDAIDKLKTMDVELDGDLQTIMLLNSLPDSFENFRCAIESRDNLPTADELKIKILEESDARRQKTQNISGGFHSNNRSFQGISKKKIITNDEKPKTSEKRFNLNCLYCKMKGHVISECRKKKKFDNQINNADDCTFTAPTNCF